MMEYDETDVSYCHNVVSVFSGIQTLGKYGALRLRRDRGFAKSLVSSFFSVSLRLRGEKRSLGQAFNMEDSLFCCRAM